MTQPRQVLPNGGRTGPGFNPSAGGNSPQGKGPLSVQLITSTGGLLGASGALMTPATAFNGAPYIIIHDPTNFNCEESAEYDFRQEASPDGSPYEGRVLTVNLIVLKYREIGIAKFSINVTVFKRDIDDFVTVQIPVSIPAKPLTTINRKKLFPDGKIHTIRLQPPKGVIQGERPQVTITRGASTGPFSITKFTMCGMADEVPLA